MYRAFFLTVPSHPKKGNGGGIKGAEEKENGVETLSEVGGQNLLKTGGARSRSYFIVLCFAFALQF